MSYPVIEFEQPAGTFYLTAMPAAEIIRISRANPRIFNPDTLTSEGGVQREPSRKRVKGLLNMREAVMQHSQRPSYWLSTVAIVFWRTGRFRWSVLELRTL
jgi:hypothetical protein